MAKKNVLNIFEKGSKARRKLKRGLKDKTLTRRELRKVIGAGATEKQSRQILKRIGKSDALSIKKNVTKEGVGEVYKKIRSKKTKPTKTEAVDQTGFDLGNTGKVKDDPFTFDTDLTDGVDTLKEEYQGFNEQMSDMFDRALTRMDRIDPVERERIEGIRFADRGTGGRTRRQLARRGTSGVFGRKGLRISSLNI